MNPQATRVLSKVAPTFLSIETGKQMERGLWTFLRENMLRVPT
jgi:hypothetical protein